VRHARFEFAEPTEEGVEYISENLREADREETYASSGHRQYHDTLRLGLAGSRSCVMALTACGEPVALLGVVTVSVLYSVGSPWMLATDRAYSFRRAFIECGRVYTAAMLGVYESLENHVDARNQRSIDWLRRLGYVIGPAKPYGALGLPFHLFRRGR
jgi:hypothetical protein